MHVNRLRHKRGREMESTGTYISNWEAPTVYHEFIGSEEDERQQLEGNGSNLRRSGRNRRHPDRYGVPLPDY